MWVREGNNFDNLFFQCLRQYITFEVMEGAYDISCPDPNCPTQVSNSLHSLVNSKITFNSGSLEPDPDGNFNRQTLDGKTPNFPLKHRGLAGRWTDVVPQCWLRNHLPHLYRQHQVPGGGRHLSHLCQGVLQPLLRHLAPRPLLC